MVAILLAIGGAALSVFTFICGKLFAQSEKILDLKRMVYADFLKFCPAPNEAHTDLVLDQAEIQRQIGIVSVYGAPDVLKFAAEYFQVFAEGQEVLIDVEQAGHPVFFQVMSAYNRMIWAMRNDALQWSMFAPDRRSREYKPSMLPEKTP